MSTIFNEVGNKKFDLHAQRSIFSFASHVRLRTSPTLGLSWSWRVEKMSKSKFGAIAASVFGLALSFAPAARASVILTFDDGDANAANATSITVAPGVSFAVNLKLTANAGEQISGVNYDVI